MQQLVKCWFFKLLCKIYYRCYYNGGYSQYQYK